MPRDFAVLEEGTIIRDRWKIVKKLGQGGFGAVYETIDIHSKEPGALKMEMAHEKHQVLRMEVCVLRKLQFSQHAARFQGCGRNDRFNYVVMGLVGKNLGDCRKECTGNKFTISTACRIGLQCLKALEDMHSIGFIHRDIKPGNYAMGRAETQRRVYILDFGLARKWMNEKNEPRQARPVAAFRGTVRYASANTHKNKEMGPHDDLWCLFYMVVEMIVGRLPWKELREKGEVGRMKESCKGSELCAGTPEEFILVYRYLRTLQYPETPEYGQVRDPLTTLLKRYHVDIESDPFDWEDGAKQLEANREDPSPPSKTTREQYKEQQTEDQVPESSPSKRSLSRNIFQKSRKSRP